MARPPKKSLEYFPTDAKLLYDTKIKALRRAFKESGDANNAFFVFDYLFREIMGNDGYYVEYSESLIGDTADFCYVTETFVSKVVKECSNIGLFDVRQKESNGILTSRSIQKKWLAAKRCSKSVWQIRREFCVLDDELLQEKPPVIAHKPPVIAHKPPVIAVEMPQKKRKKIKRKENKEKEIECSDIFISEISSVENVEPKETTETNFEACTKSYDAQLKGVREETVKKIKVREIDGKQPQTQLPYEDGSQTMDAIREYVKNENLVEAIRSWVTVRFDYGKIIGPIQIQLALKELFSLGLNDEEKIECVKDATLGGWAKFYKRKKDEKEHDDYRFVDYSKIDYKTGDFYNE